MTEQVISRLNDIKREGEKSKAFQEYRRKHYDEFITLKKLAESGKLPSDEESVTQPEDIPPP